MDNVRGSLFMVLAMAAFACEDMFIKAASSTVAIGFVMAIFGFFGMMIFIFFTLKRGEVILHPAILSRPILARAVCEVTGRLSFAAAISLMALSDASAILQAIPLITMLGAAAFFGEHIDLKRWIAVLVGFVGVLLIIQPGQDSFEVASILAVISTFGFAGRDLATRAAPPVLSNMQLGVYGFFVLIPVGLAMLFYSGQTIEMNMVAASQIAGATIFGVIAYNALTIAMRTGDVSVVAPFRYVRLLFAMVLGVMVFAERPDSLTLLGSLLIVLSGGYTLMKSRKNAVLKS